MEIDILKTQLTQLKAQEESLSQTYYKNYRVITEKIRKLSQRIERLEADNLKISSGQYWLEIDKNITYHGDYFTLFYINEYVNSNTIKTITWRIHRSDDDIWAVIEKKKCNYKDFIYLTLLDKTEAQAYIDRTNNLDISNL